MTWQAGAFVSDEHDAEEMAALHMRQLGFADAVRMPVGPDGGVDVTSSAALAQVKFKAQITGRPELQRLFGARGLDQSRAMLFYGSARYSPAAVEYAEMVGMALFTYDVHGRTTAINGAASTLEATGASGRSRNRAGADGTGSTGPGWWRRNWIPALFWFCVISLPVNAQGLLDGVNDGWTKLLLNIMFLAILTPLWRRWLRRRSAQAEETSPEPPSM